MSVKIVRLITLSLSSTDVFGRITTEKKVTMEQDLGNESDNTSELPGNVDESNNSLNNGGAEVNGNGAEVDGNGTEVDANGTEVDANGTEVGANGTEVDANGTEVDGNGTDGNNTKTEVDAASGTTENLTTETNLTANHTPIDLTIFAPQIQEFEEFTNALTAEPGCTSKAGCGSTPQGEVTVGILEAMKGIFVDINDPDCVQLIDHVLTSSTHEEEKGKEHKKPITITSAQAENLKQCAVKIAAQEKVEKETAVEIEADANKDDGSTGCLAGAGETNSVDKEAAQQAKKLEEDLMSGEAKST